MTVPIAAYLRARVAEDEATAQTASPPPWYPNTPDDLSIGNYGWSFGAEQAGGDPGTFDYLAAEATDSEQGKADALHIARFADPAAVLADVALKRSILDAWDDASREPGADASYAWVLLRDVVIMPWLQRYAGRPGFLPAWATVGNADG